MAAERRTLQPHRFTADEYWRLLDAGVLAHDSRAQLLDGLIVDMPPIRLSHGVRHAAILVYLARVVEARAIVAAPVSVNVGPFDVPEPDISLLDPACRARGTIPDAADLWVAIEIADTSTRLDLSVKAALYARGGISDYLVVDIPRQRLVHHGDPAPDGYRHMRSLAAGDEFVLQRLPGLRFSATPFIED